MYERIIEIIMLVVAEFRRCHSINAIDLDELQRRGYTSAEISAAFSWLVDKVEFTKELLPLHEATQPSSFRMLHEAERELFTREALGELVQLQELGIVGTQHIEEIIERTLMSGMKRVSARDLKNMVAILMFNTQHTQGNGFRLMLEGNETIN